MANYDTSVVLLNTPLVDYKNQILFSSEQKQLEYFLSKEIQSFDNLNYLNSNRRIKVGCHIDSITSVNYMMYRNTEFSNKWYYGFVKEKKYISNNATEIIFELDSFQTYQFNIEYLPSYIVREHTIPQDKTLLTEGFEIGEMEIIQQQEIYKKQSNYLIVLGQIEKTDKVKDGKTNSLDEIIEMISYPVSLNRFSMAIDDVPYSLLFVPCTYSDCLNYLHVLYNSNSVISVVRYTGDISDFSTSSVNGIPYLNDKGEQQTISLNCVSGVTGDRNKIVGTWNKPTNGIFDCYPFSYSTLSDGEHEMLIKHELVKSLNVKGSWSFGISPIERYYLDNYNNDRDGYTYNITNANPTSIPFCTSKYSDYFLSSQNAIKANAKEGMWEATSGLVKGSVASISMSNPMPMINGGLGGYSSLSSVRNEIAKQSDLINQPSNVKSLGTVGGDVAFKSNRVKITTYQIKQETQDKILAYWRKFGYKCCKIKVPNLRLNNEFNYIETKDLNFNCLCDNNSKTDIKNMFDGGTTLWHNDINFLNYDVENKKRGEENAATIS